MFSKFSRDPLGLTLACAFVLFSSHGIASPSGQATVSEEAMTKVIVDAKELIQAASEIQAAKPAHQRGAALVIQRHPDGTLSTLLGGQEVVLDVGGSTR